MKILLKKVHHTKGDIPILMGIQVKKQFLMRVEQAMVDMEGMMVLVVMIITVGLVDILVMVLPILVWSNLIFHLPLLLSLYHHILVSQYQYPFLSPSGEVVELC